LANTTNLRATAVRITLAFQAPPKVAAVMLDGGRYQVRAEDQGQGVVDAAWKETKVACCQTLSAAEAAKDPQPQPPRKFLEPTAVARLVSTMKTRPAVNLCDLVKRSGVAMVTSWEQHSNMNR
jgi:hypothetical protein